MYGRSYTIWGQEAILTILISFSHVQLLQPQLAGLLSPWDFPGKNTRVGLLFPPPNHLFHDKALPWPHVVQPNCFIKALWFDLLERMFKIISTQIWLLTKLLLLIFSYFTSFLTVNVVPLHVVHENPVLCLVAPPCLTLCDPVDCSPSGSSVHGSLQARKQVGCHALLQGIFPTEGLNPGLLLLQADSLPSEPPLLAEGGSLSFLQGNFSTQESNRDLLHENPIRV